MEFGKKNYDINRIDEEEKHLIQEKESQLIKDVVDYFISSQAKLIARLQNEVDDENVKNEILSEAKKQFAVRNVTDANMEEMLKKFSNFMWGYDVIEELINDDDISDIKCYSHNHIRVKKLGKRKDAGVSFFDSADYKRFIQLVAVKNQQNLSAINALPIFTDTKSNAKFRLRFDIRSDLLVTNEIPCMHIRKIPKKKYTMDILQDKKMMTKEQKEYLIDKAKNSNGILFVGKNASGKTYLMNALLEYIPHENSVLVCQESDELFSDNHPDLLCTHILRSNGEGKISYGLDKLAENALVSDNDYIIVGEIKSGSEAKEFSKCSYTGMVCWTSVHGSKYKGMYKLADYVKLATGYEYDECLKQLEDIETIVFLKEFKIKGIYENKGWNSKKMDLDIEEVTFHNLDDDEVADMFI
jgi:pilus assembly protein CpaF